MTWPRLTSGSRTPWCRTRFNAPVNSGLGLDRLPMVPSRSIRRYFLSRRNPSSKLVNSRAICFIQAESGLVVMPATWTRRRGQFDDEQHVEGQQAVLGPDFDREEVRCRQVLPMGAEELLPGGLPTAIWRGLKPVLLEDVGDGVGTDFVAEVPNPPHHAPRAKSVIFLFMEGGPSHLDLFDPKPLLNKLAGQPLPAELRHASSPRWARAESPLLASPAHLEAARPERPLGFRLAAAHRRHARIDLAVIRSCWADGINHVGRRLPDEHRLDPRRPAVARALGQLRPGHREPESAGLRGACRTTQAQVVNGPRNWGAGLHARRVPGHPHRTAAASRSRI